MSWNRENVMWESPNGSWNRGYWAIDYIDPNGDPEWDVEYSYNRFEEWHTGLASLDAANRIDRGQGGHAVAFTPENAEYIERLEKALANSAQRRRASRR
jgi:hypothetical protein